MRPTFVSTLDSLRLGLVADDLTGALDSGAQLALFGLETVVALTPAYTAEPPGLVLTTDSREVDRREAARRVEGVMGRLVGRSLFKKIDSTLRGHVAVEAEAAARASGADRVLLCPAAPDLGRVVREGRLLVDGTPLHETGFARDPAWPAATSDMAAILSAPSTHLGLDLVRGSPERLAGAIHRAATLFVTADAESESDLRALAGAALTIGALPCGSLGLARAWIEALAGPQTAPPPDPGDLIANLEKGPVLVVSGSLHPMARRQIEALSKPTPDHAEGFPRIMVPTGSDRDGQRGGVQLNAPTEAAGCVILCAGEARRGETSQVSQTCEVLARFAREIVSCVNVAGVVLVGGETAREVCRALEVDAVHLLGQLEPGFPLGRLVSGPLAGRWCLTKAGGFGEPETLARWVLPLIRSIQKGV